MFASCCSQIRIFKVLQSSLRKDLALPESVRARATAAASTDLSEMLLAGQITEMQWVAKLSFITSPADLGHGGSPCSLLCRQGSFSAVAAPPAARQPTRQSRCGRAGGQSLQHGVTLTSPQQDAASQMHCAGCQQASRQTLFLFSVLSLCPPASNSVWCVGCGDKAVVTRSLCNSGVSLPPPAVLMSPMISPCQFRD